MKKRLINREIWRQKSFRDMKGWAQLLDIYMYLDLADFAGIAELDLGLAEYNLKLVGMMPENMDVVAIELQARWERIGEFMFIRRNFLDETQGGVIKLNNASHLYIFQDMVERWKSGLTDVVRIVLENNPSTRFQKMSEAEAEADLKKKHLLGTNDKDKLNGFKSIEKSLETARRCYQVLTINSLPLIASTSADFRKKPDELEDNSRNHSDER